MRGAEASQALMVTGWRFVGAWTEIRPMAGKLLIPSISHEEGGVRDWNAVILSVT